MTSNKNNIFIIISSIVCDTKYPLDYCSTRSIFSANERFSQTLRTISSIRDKNSECEILLIDNTPVPTEWVTRLESKCEYSLFTYENNGLDQELNDFLKNYPNKGHSECSMMLQALYFLSKNCSKNFNLYFKISGRYYLNDKFNLDNFDLDKYTFKKNSDFGYGLFTTLYSVPHILLDNFFYHTLFSFSVTSNALPPHLGYSLESNLLSKEADEDYNNMIKFIDTLGIEGNIGPSGELHSH